VKDLLSFSQPAQIRTRIIGLIDSAAILVGNFQAGSASQEPPECQRQPSPMNPAHRIAKNNSNLRCAQPASQPGHLACLAKDGTIDG